jgi:hypothetical protein
MRLLLHQDVRNLEQTIRKSCCFFLNDDNDIQIDKYMPFSNFLPQTAIQCIILFVLCSDIQKLIQCPLIHFLQRQSTKIKFLNGVNDNSCDNACREIILLGGSISTNDNGDDNDGDNTGTSFNVLLLLHFDDNDDTNVS